MKAMKIGAASFLFFSVFFLCADFARAAAPSLVAGAASVDITPDPGAINWTTNRPYDGVIDPLHARALYWGSGAEQVAVLTLDITDISEPDVAEIRRVVAKAISIPLANILINASHNHSGPTSPQYKEVGNPKRIAETNELLERWKRELPERCAQAARDAKLAARSVSLQIGRAYVGEWLFNRRPVRPDGTVKSTLVPADPNVLPDGLRFGPVDPVIEVLAFRDGGGKSVATLFNLSCHAVAVYSQRKGVSADWPGAACRTLQQTLGGEVLFLQGCGGDIVPARRGLDQARDMGAGIAQRVATAVSASLTLKAAPLLVSRAIIGLPLTEASVAQLGRTTTQSEIQVISCGELALVALPGEPLIEISRSIKKGSPFAHTLVLGYSNGDGVEYVGVPGEKAKGGYEMGPYGLGTDECGGFMIATAVRLLREQHASGISAAPLRSAQ